MSAKSAKATKSGTAGGSKNGGLRVDGFSSKTTTELAEEGIRTKDDMMKWAEAAQAEIASGTANLRSMSLTLSIQRHMFQLEKCELMYSAKSSSRTKRGFFLHA